MVGCPKRGASVACTGFDWYAPRSAFLSFGTTGLRGACAGDLSLTILNASLFSENTKLTGELWSKRELELPIWLSDCRSGDELELPVVKLLGEYWVHLKGDDDDGRGDESCKGGSLCEGVLFVGDLKISSKPCCCSGVFRRWWVGTNLGGC
jgi:hypothetical protein